MKTETLEQLKGLRETLAEEIDNSAYNDKAEATDLLRHLDDAIAMDAILCECYAKEELVPLGGQGFGVIDEEEVMS